MTTIADLCHSMESIAAPGHAAQWDNVGLLIGRHEASANRILLTIDLTAAVLAEAVAMGVDAILAYHPPLFDPIKQINDDDETGRLLLGLIGAGISVYTPHTALDAAPDGLNDWLIQSLGDGHATPLEHSDHLPLSEANKIVTYVPRESVDAVRQALAAAGAGLIGAYSHCSTAIDNEGTFLPGDRANPVIGERGKLEQVAEQRLMMVCSDAALPGALAALAEAHPYEEPPIHVIALRPRPVSNTGLGRVLRLKTPVSTATAIDRVKHHLGVSQLRVAQPTQAEHHEVVACCAGAGGSLAEAAHARGATLFLTGEMRHHDVLAAIARGSTILLAGHTNTERGFLPILRDRLALSLPQGDILVSERDRTPWMSV